MPFGVTIQPPEEMWSRRLCVPVSQAAAGPVQAAPVQAERREVPQELADPGVVPHVR